MTLVLALGALVVCGLLLLAYAVLAEPYQPVFKRFRLDLPPNWPDDLQVLHISDLHVRRDDARLRRAQIAALQGLTPDVLCVTGDVCEKVRDIPLLIEVLRAARPRLGTYIVLGNHEHNAPAPEHLREQHKRGFMRMIGGLLDTVAPRLRSDGEEEGHAMAEVLRSAGFTVLHNEGVRVRKNGQSVWIAGTDSAWAGHADMLAAMRGRHRDEPCLALIHEPDLAFEAEAMGADLVLAGHTHGGQIRLPFIGTPYTLRMDPRISVAAGFQRLEAGLLHITAGLGHTIPLRFGCPPEVVWMDCQSPVTVDQADEEVFERLMRGDERVEAVA